MAGDSPAADEVALWYTRDRGGSWHCGPKAVAGQDGITFDAPGEGLYGFYIVARGAGGASAPEPGPGTAPHRWVYVDYTPPLAQWKGVEPISDASGTRRLAMSWAAYDANFDSRPIALAYQPAGRSEWMTIDSALPNTGRFDWTPPADLVGRVTFKLVARDCGGHVVERLFGPMQIEAHGPVAVADTQPAARRAVLASPTASRPSDPVMTDPALRDRARRLYDQGTWHRERGQYAEAQERLLEALELDPGLLPARTDLAGVLYSRGRYGEAIAEYLRVIRDDPARATALRGLALAYMARREYASARETLERLLLREEKNAEAWLDLGDVLYQMGDRGAARAHWSKAASVDPAAASVVLKARNRLSLFPLTPHQPSAPEGN